MLRKTLRPVCVFYAFGHQYRFKRLAQAGNGTNELKLVRIT